ncbi:MAG: hypothetical protein GX444_00760 [Myxococcales bacterium]|nr:hypothetical protein [Myxococcales bacterium]
MSRKKIFRGFALLVLLALFFAGCGSTGDDDDDRPGTTDDDDNDDFTPPPGDDDDDNDDNDDNDDDNDDNDDNDNDDNDNDNDDNDDNDTTPFTVWENPNAKADAFRLYYKERLSRILPAYNRFKLVGDVVPAMTLGSTAIAKSGTNYDVALHPVDNNDFGWSAFNVYQAYKYFGRRDQALTLIRQFEGLAVAEEISGIPGLTCREWWPGFTINIDGLTGTITRTKDGDPIDPAEAYDPSLEAEIVDAFFADGVYNVRADPTDTYFHIEPILNPADYAVTFVFAEMPNYLRISNCCSSFMVSQLGTFAGYFWGNHNSRDNFPDFAMGYFAACEAKDDPNADADVRASAERACNSGKRVGDSVVENGYNLMTVGEFEPYDADHLIVAGELRPDGTDEGPEWLGSMNMCQMSYMAKAMSTTGLSSPDEAVETPGSYEILGIKALFELLGLQPPEITKTCHNIDDFFVGLPFGSFLTLEVFGVPLWDLIATVLELYPDEVWPVLLDLADALDQPEMAIFAVVYYARITAGKDELLHASQETLWHIVEIQRRASQLVYDWAMAQDPPNTNAANQAEHYLTMAALYAHIGGVGNADFDPFDFVNEENYNEGFEAVLNRPDSSLRGLMTDEYIWERILAELDGYADRPLTYDRYWERFPTEADKPLRRLGDNYEAVGLDGDFHEIANISHQWFGGLDLWKMLPACVLAPNVLDCEWAALGCERPDLDASGLVDSADQTLFESAWATYGPPNSIACTVDNSWCDGGDLDRSGLMDEEDQAFFTAAIGCWY